MTENQLQQLILSYGNAVEKIPPTGRKLIAVALGLDKWFRS
jgi:hypothetical protein